MNIIGWLIFGLIVGLIAKLLMPGKDPGGCFATVALGVAGSFAGGYLGKLLLGGKGDAAGWIGSIIGALILLWLYRMIIKKKEEGT